MYQYQIASCPDEVNYNVYNVLQNVDVKQWIKRQPENLSAFLKRILVEALKTKYRCIP